MPALRIHLLGSVELSRGSGRRLELAASCRSLLGYLCMNRHRLVSRQEVASAVWAELDDGRARRCLSTALWRLKTTPGLDHDLVRNSGPDEIGLNPSNLIWIDIAAFEARAAAWQNIAPEQLGPAACHRLAKAVATYNGDFLPRVEEDWAFLERQRLRTLYCDALYQLTAAYCHAENFIRAIVYGRRLCAIEPLREDVHRLLMRAYVATGNRGKAIEQYRVCQGELGSELGVTPMPETQALFHSIVERDAVRPPARGALIAASLGAADDNVRWVRRALRRSDDRLAEALALIERALRTNPPSTS